MYWPCTSLRTGSSEGPVPVIRLYGVTQTGLSVMAYVHGFTPYLYVSLSSSIDASDTALNLMRMTLDEKVYMLLCVVSGATLYDSFISLYGLTYISLSL